MASTKIFRNIGTLLSLEGVARKDGRFVKEADLSIIKKAALVVTDGKVAWLGPQQKLPKAYVKKTKEFDCDQQTVLPAFIECHTHLVFAGDRSQEFEMRNCGVSYQEIARRGGGILSTMTATRKASAAELLKLAQVRAQNFVDQGVATIEAKSGYALNEKDELKTLEVSKKIKGPEVINTFLGAHAIPAEFKSGKEYLDFLAQKVLPKVKKKSLATRVDIFVEKGFFSNNEAQEYLTLAKAMGFDIVVHADQLSKSGGTQLAMDLDAASADHIIQIDDSLISALSKSNVTGVLLPSADLYMKCDYPPARKLIDAGVRVALATDFNPGSSPSQDLSLVGILARLEMKMSLPEVISAYTWGAASALKLSGRKGSLSPQKDADFICTAEDWTKFFYEVGSKKVVRTFLKGVRIN